MGSHFTGKRRFLEPASLLQIQPPSLFAGASCTPTLLAIEEAAHGGLEKDRVSPEESRPWTWDGREAPTRGAFSEQKAEACAPKFTELPDSGGKVHTCLTFCLALFGQKDKQDREWPLCHHGDSGAKPRVCRTG